MLIMIMRGAGRITGTASHSGHMKKPQITGSEYMTICRSVLTRSGRMADAQADAAKSSADGSSAKAAAGSERVLQEKMAACGIVAIAAIRDQDDFSLDMVQTGALQKAREVVEEFSSDTV